MTPRARASSRTTRSTGSRRCGAGTAGAADQLETYAYNALGALTVNVGVVLDHQRPRLDGGGTAGAGVPRTMGGQPVTLSPLGRVESLFGTTLEYGPHGLLWRTSNGTTTNRFTYDPFQRLVSRTIDNVPMGFRYDYRDLPQDGGLDQDVLGNVLAVHDPAQGGAIWQRFLFEGIDQPLWYVDESQLVSAYYELDTLGNVRRIRAGRRLGTGPALPSDLGGYRYTAFGKTIAATASTPAPTIRTTTGTAKRGERASGSGGTVAARSRNT